MRHAAAVTTIWYRRDVLAASELVEPQLVAALLDCRQHTDVIIITVQSQNLYIFHSSLDLTLLNTNSA